MSDNISLFIPTALDPDVVCTVLHDIGGANIHLVEDKMMLQGTADEYRWCRLGILNPDDPADPYALYLHHGGFDAEASDGEFPEGTHGTYVSMVNDGQSKTYLRLLLNQFGGLLTDDDGALREFASEGVIHREMRS